MQQPQVCAAPAGPVSPLMFSVTTDVLGHVLSSLTFLFALPFLLLFSCFVLPLFKSITNILPDQMRALVVSHSPPSPPPGPSFCLFVFNFIEFWGMALLNQII